MEGKDDKGRFLPGHKFAKGRPKGARNKLDSAFVKALYKDFKEHGAEVIAELRANDPKTYVNVIPKILPKQIQASVDHDHSHKHYVISAEPEPLGADEWERMNLPSSGDLNQGRKLHS